MNRIPLVFIHAFPLSQCMWDANRPTFERNFSFITVDLPGFGAAPSLGSIASMASMADHVLAELEKQRINQPFVLAGLSMGGYVALQILNKVPDRVRAVAFLSTPASADSPEVRERRFKNIEFVTQEGSAAFAERMIPGLIGKTSIESTPALVAQLKRWISSTPSESIVAALRGMAERPDMTSVLDSLSIPTLFLAGEEDKVVSAQEMEEMSRRVKKGLFKTIPKSGHLINLENPRLFDEAILHFLKSRVL